MLRWYFKQWKKIFEWLLYEDNKGQTNKEKYVAYRIIKKL